MINQSNSFKNVQTSSEFLKRWHPKAPDICIVLGSGLSNAIPNIAEMKNLHFSEIPGFKSANVAGHAGDLRVGEIEIQLPNGTTKKREIAFLRGRNHGYEGNNAGEVVHNVRSMISWGVKGIILTNAAGCLNTDWELGRMMIISDHINSTGMSPLNGEFGEGFGARFVDMTSCYTISWQKQFAETAHALGHKIYNGVYYGVMGSQYETPAEIRMMQMLGANSVGMSTVLEAIAARQLGAKIAGISCLTNYGAGLKHKVLDHSDVMDMGSLFSQDMANIVLKTAVALEV
ncbi:purine-nucleoside phosphorylase [Fluviispira multicolorata]|uniref:Purine nucleoside phosphorylase n=1 Tax=Fluviispira multicolorata TaxID=2654512 RepID=A0A833JEC3_9BACT|nr:purine-nucleoside phosphorylase [Fluviispira multicolorata]KAB8033151.1 purine-nucleoside phosphorylase [Fluviispira multicolorata]